MAELEVDIVVDEQTLEEEARAIDAQRQQMFENLATAIRSKFEIRAARRSPKENQWIRGAQLYYGKLGLSDSYIKPESPFSTPIYKSRPDVNVVRSKCSIAVAQTVSMQFGTGNKNWDIWPSLQSTDPNNIKACVGMSDTIESQLDESKYSLHCRKAMTDRVMLGTGILKGPISTGKLVRAYEKLEGTETWLPSLSVDYAPTLSCVNPWFFYPDETTHEQSHINDCIEIHPMTALELKKLINHEGFKADQIQEVLESKPEDYNLSSWSDFASISENNPNLFKNKYVVMEYHGPITKTQLNMLEIEPCYDAIDDEYYGEVWVCQDKIIRLELEAIEATYRIPYYISVWEKDPGSVFGFGVPLMMEDAQRVVNETWHMILDNCVQSSAPQVAMQKHLVEPANGKWEIGPKQIWYLTDVGQSVRDAIQFFTTPNVTANIVPIMQMAQGFAEEESGIPLITAGLQSPEGQDTATGTMIMRQASTTLLDFMSEEWDDNITEPVIAAYYAWNMQNSPDSSIKGSYNIDVRTSTQYKNKQLHIRDLEKLSVEAAQNPEMAKYINQDVLTAVRLSMMSIPDKTIIKSDEQMAQEAEAAKNQPPSPEIMELQLKARDQDLKEAQLAFEVKQQQQREIWDHEEKMTANQARLVESEARVAVSQNDKETELIKLAQRSQTTAAQLSSNEKIATQNNQTKAFLLGLEETRKQQEADSYQNEIDLAATKGEGV